MKNVTILLRLTKIKILDLLNRPVMLVMLLLLPMLLGSIAGVANLRNIDKDIFLAVLDEDKSQASNKVIEDLKAKGWTIFLPTENEAQRMLLREEVDGLLVIDLGFEAELSDFDNPHLRYYEAEGSMVTTMVQEVIVASALPLYSQEAMVDQIGDLYMADNRQIPEDLKDRFARRIEELSKQEALITIDFVGNLRVAPTLTFVVSDYSMEVFFLSIYAILGTLSLCRADLRRRLGSTSRGLAFDYTATLISLQLLGLVQIIIYTASMNLLMSQPVRLNDLLILFVFLFVMLGFGQLLSLIEESMRLYLSLLALLFSAFIGGCFFQLSHNMLNKYGQYSPHGWALSAIRGTRVAPLWIVILIGAGMLFIGYFVQKKRINTD